MPTREEILAFITELFSELIHSTDDIWIALYKLLLDYIHGVPRITDSNRLKVGIWRKRAQQIEQIMAEKMTCQSQQVPNQLDIFMRKLYMTNTQRMNPIGIAFACAIVCLLERFSHGKYMLKMEAKIGTDVFPNLSGFRRKSIDIVALHHGRVFAVISSKWGLRHDRIRDPQEEADTYKQEEPSLKFFVVTNEYDSARLQKLLTYPTIDGVFHIKRDLVWQAYGKITTELANLKDFTELFAFFP